MAQESLFKFSIQEDPNEREQWEEFKEGSLRSEKVGRFTMSYYNFFRKTLKIDPRKVSKKDAANMMHDLVKGKQVGHLIPTYDKEKHKYTGEYFRARETARRLIDLKTGKPKGAFKRGLYWEMQSLHEMKSSKGKSFIRSYQSWNQMEISILKSNANFSKKVELLGRSEKSVKRKLERLQG